MITVFPRLSNISHHNLDDYSHRDLDNNGITLHYSHHDLDNNGITLQSS